MIPRFGRELARSPTEPNGALIEGAYRYRLWRTVDATLPGSVLWVMLNPSTADAQANDNTIRKCMGYTQRWGFGRMTVVNLFALRSTDPKNLYPHPDPIGPKNDQHLAGAFHTHDLVIAAWGNHGTYKDRDRAVVPLAQGKSFMCLRVSTGGNPYHPLYLPNEAKPIQWEPRA